MDSYHRRSNSLLQNSYIYRNNSSPVTTSYEKEKSDLRYKNSYYNSNECQKTNDSYYDSESFKKKILSPSDSVISRYNNPIMNKCNNDYHSIYHSHSFTKSSTKKCKKILLLDLDETLVHSSFRPLPFKADIELPVIFDGVRHHVYVMKRPFVDEFLKKMSELYDIYIFTASIPQYANPLLDRLDVHRVIKHRLFRGDCLYRNEGYIKDLSVVNKEMKDMILLDNNPISYAVNLMNGMPILTWHDDKSDTELSRLIPLLEYLSTVDDVTRVISKIVSNEKVDYNKVNKLLQNNSEPRFNIKNINKPETSLTRSKSSSIFSPQENYERKLREWNELKEKIVKNLEEFNCSSLSQHHSHYAFYNNENYQSPIINRSNLKLTPNQDQYCINKQTRYNKEKDNRNNHTMLYNTNKVICFIPKTIQELQRDNILSQTSTSFYINKPVDIKDLKRTSSCKCLRSEWNELSSNNNNNHNNTNNNIEVEHSFFRNSYLTPAKSNYFNFYKTAEEEKSIYKPSTDSKIYSSWSSQKDVYENTPQKAVNHCNTNYYTTIKKNTSTKNMKEKQMLTPSPFLDKYKKTEKKKASLATTKKRLLFNTSTMGCDYSFLSNSHYSLNNNPRSLLNKKEKNCRNTCNQFYYAVDNKKELFGKR